MEGLDGGRSRSDTYKWACKVAKSRDAKKWECLLFVTSGMTAGRNEKHVMKEPAGSWTNVVLDVISSLVAFSFEISIYQALFTMV